MRSGVSMGMIETQSVIIQTLIMNSISLGNHPMMDPPLYKKISDYIFNFDDLLGEGSFSKVYKGHNEITGQSVAIKIVQFQTVKSVTLEKLLHSEIDVLKHLNHPNTLKCFEVFCSQRNCYIICELCNEGTLETKLRREGPFSEEKAESIIKNIFQGLKYLEENGIVHRDLKVANIFINDGIAKIADFGFAQFSKQNFRDANIGSPLYMAPQGYINNIYGPKTDIWSFGILIYELLHGSPPFAYCNTESDLFYAMTVGLKRQKLKEDLSEEIKEVILRCMQIDEKKRPTISKLSFLPYFTKMFMAPTHNSSQPQSKASAGRQNQVKQLYQTSKAIIDPPKIQQQSLSSKQSTQPEHPFLEKDIKTKQNQKTDKQYDQTRKNRFSTISKIPEYDKTNYPLRGNLEKDAIVSQSLSLIADNSDKIMKGRVNFTQCVSTLHYGRAIFKFLLLFKQELSDQDSSVLFTLTKWLLQLLQEIRLKITREEVEYPGDRQIYSQKLLEVCEEYQKKYALELSSYIVVSNHCKEEGYSLDFMKYCCLGIFQKIDSMITSSSHFNLLLMGELMVIICEATKLLSSCYSRGNYKQLQNHRQPQIFLRDYRQNTNYECYLKFAKKLTHY